MQPREFLNRYKVFRIEEFSARTGLSGRAREASLQYYRKKGRLLPVRRGLYWVVPYGYTSDNCPVDPYLVAGHLSDDATIAYHSALELHGYAYSTFNEIQFISGSRIRSFSFRGTRFHPFLMPPALSRTGQQNLGVEALDRSGEKLRVTTLERCLVDLLDRPESGGGWEEIWRSLETIGYLNAEQVCAYAVALDNATTAAKTGWFLQLHQDRLMVSESTLEKLRDHRPNSPHYLSRNRQEPTRFLPEWNLVVPKSLADRHWEEPL